MKKLIATVFLTLAATGIQAKPGHVADDVYVYYHGGPNNSYRITGRIRSGTPIEILERNSKSKYVKIKTASGRTGWMPEASVNEGASIQIRMPKLETDLKSSKELASTQASEIEQLKGELTELKQQNNGYSSDVETLQQEIKSLQHKIDGMDQSNTMRWFTHGGLVALGGVLLGLLIPFFPRRQKRRADYW